MSQNICDMSKVNAEIKYCRTVNKFCPTNHCHCRYRHRTSRNVSQSLNITVMLMTEMSSNVSNVRM